MSAALANSIGSHTTGALGFCANCGGEVRLGKQLWQCQECGQVRIWGWTQAADPKLKPLLNCAGCGCPTRHEYMGIAGRNY